MIYIHRNSELLQLTTLIREILRCDENYAFVSEIKNILINRSQKSECAQRQQRSNNPNDLDNTNWTIRVGQAY